MVHFTPTSTTGVKQPLQTGATPDFSNSIALEKTFRRLAGTQALSQAPAAPTPKHTAPYRRGCRKRYSGAGEGSCKRQNCEGTHHQGRSSHGELQGHIIRQPRV